MRVLGMLKFFCDIFLSFLNWGLKKDIIDFFLVLMI